MRRLLTVLSMVALLMIPAAPAAALSYNGYTWTGTMWVDNNCDSTDNWRIIVSSEANGGGHRTQICSNESDLGKVPMIKVVPPIDSCVSYPTGPRCLLINGVWWGAANDVISWVKLTKMNWGPTSGCKWRIRFYDDNDYSPSFGIKTIATVGEYGFAAIGSNDRSSSVRAVCLNI